MLRCVASASAAASSSLRRRLCAVITSSSSSHSSSSTTTTSSSSTTTSSSSSSSNTGIAVVARAFTSSSIAARSMARCPSRHRQHQSPYHHCCGRFFTSAAAASPAASSTPAYTHGAGARALTAAELEAFARDGYLVVPDFATADACAAVRARAIAIVDEWSPPPAMSTVFSTEEQTRVSDDYFLTSGDQIRCFFEPDAVRDDGSGELKPDIDQRVAINKIGHALHERDVVMRPFFDNAGCEALVTSLGYTAPWLLQSMYIFKQPDIGAPVSVHQDCTFLYTEPASVTGLWCAVEDATVDNGCLWVVPGSHVHGTQRRFLRNPDTTVGGTVFEPPQCMLSEDGAVAVPVVAGTCVLLHGDLVHFSRANTSARSRHAFTIHIVESGTPRACDIEQERRLYEAAATSSTPPYAAPTTTRYPASNWLQRTDGGTFRGFTWREGE